MQEVDINQLVNENNILKENIPNDIIIVGKIYVIYINNEYDKLDLSKVDCYEICYRNQEGESIKNHILPNSLECLFCSYNQLISLPNLPDSLKVLNCENNQLTSLPDLSHFDNDISIYFNQSLPIKYIPYNTKIKLYEYEPNQINIEDYPYNPITNQKELDKYMKYVLNFNKNKIKSARK